MNFIIFSLLFNIFIDNISNLVNSIENSGNFLSNLKKCKVMPNNLDNIMNNEALSNSQLARFAQLSDKTVGKIRKNKIDGSLNSQNKIVVGLNKNPDKVREKNYTGEQIFPNGKNPQQQTTAKGSITKNETPN
ncbi:MAG: hypothetical protein U9P70_00825 [Patescibacteria group bacterium]|nr:hypothetical protein [Patescibacteria group bacterium]